MGGLATYCHKLSCIYSFFIMGEQLNNTEPYKPKSISRQTLVSHSHARMARTHSYSSVHGQILSVEISFGLALSLLTIPKFGEMIRFHRTDPFLFGGVPKDNEIECRHCSGV